VFRLLTPLAQFGVTGRSCEEDDDARISRRLRCDGGAEVSFNSPNWTPVPRLSSAHDDVPVCGTLRSFRRCASQRHELLGPRPLVAALPVQRLPEA
jgi:hypothetical protein